MLTEYIGNDNCKGHLGVQSDNVPYVLESSYFSELGACHDGLDRRVVGDFDRD